MAHLGPPRILPAAGRAGLLCILALLAAAFPPAAGSAAGPGPRLPDAAAAILLEALKSRDPEVARAAVKRAGREGDARFIAPLIELLRAHALDLVRGPRRSEIAASLEALSGERSGASWPAWVTWYAGTELAPPPGFTGWKGQLLSRIDPRFGALLATGTPATIRVEEIVWGGVGYEGIPALDAPRMIGADQARAMRPGEPVFGVVIDGDARAYPLRILDWHEMANDTIGGVPVTLAYCTLCGSGIAFDRRAQDGRVFDFGSSGLLMRSNKLMVDRQTRSLWDQLTGRPVVGPLVSEPPLRLRVLPSVVTAWRDWRRRHPDTKVLSSVTGHVRRYEPGVPYGDYFGSKDTMFPVRPTPGMPPKTRIFGLEVEGTTRAYKVRDLTRANLVQDRVGGQSVVLVAPREPVHVDGRSTRTRMRLRYDAGAEVRAYAVGTQRFERVTREAEGEVLIDAQGRRWQVDEGGLVGPGGVELARLAGVQAYWFAWKLHHPETEVYRVGK